jgi:DMSO/TMAO reductase YedYZ molybdopterin-dependent catalytic subunit
MPTNAVITTRRAVIGGLASAGGVLLTGCSQSMPPTYGNVLRMGDLLTYGARRLLLPKHMLAREYARSDITSIPAVGTTDPGDPSSNRFNPKLGPVYQRLHADGFAQWRLRIEGLVARPVSYSLEDLQRLPARTQITPHTCEEGWSAIAEWTGVPLRLLLESAGISHQARFACFYVYDGRDDSIDMLDALHPQTIVAYGMNGRQLPVQHGAPVRLRVETQVGYKSRKYLQRIVVTDRFGPANTPVERGYAWYAGI